MLTHRIHGAGIYANIGGILLVNVTIYIPYMDPMGDGNVPISPKELPLGLDQLADGLPHLPRLRG